MAKSVLLSLCCLCGFSAVLSAKLGKEEDNLQRSYGSSGSSGSTGSSGSSGVDPYSDNFDVMYASMDINNNGKSSKVQISLPNPPAPPRPAKPNPAPNMATYENDPNRSPKMPMPPRTPGNFGAMNIDMKFPTYTPNVDDAFYDSDAAKDLSALGSSSGGYGTGSYGRSGGSGLQEQDEEPGEMKAFGGGGNVDKSARQMESQMGENPFRR